MKVTLKTPSKSSPPAKPKIRKLRPKRSYKAAFESLRQVLKISHLEEKDAILQIGAVQKKILSGNTLRVGVWNICKGSGQHPLRHELQMLMRECDLLLLQEALLTEDTLSYVENSAFTCIHAASYMRRDGIRDGVMTVSRIDPSSPSQRVLCKRPEPLLKTSKVALVTSFDVGKNGVPIVVVNLHARLIRSRKGALNETRHLIESLPQTTGPMILAGDFNTFTNGYLRDVQKELDRIGLERVAFDNDPRGVVGALDQFFVRGLDVKKSRIETTMRNSDHFPLVVELGLK